MMRQDHVLSWLRPDAPYAPFVQLGLLACLRGTDDSATTHWRADQSGFALECVLATTETLDVVAERVADAPWPELAALAWPAGFGQAIKPALATQSDKASAWQALVGPQQAVVTAPVDGYGAAARHAAALLTDGVLDKDLALGRSRLVRGVKADLSGVKAIKRDPAALKRELEQGPVWTSSGAGSGLGLVPEVQTFGGVTGPKPDSVNASSALLYALIVQALGVVPPFAVVRGPRRVVGGLLIGDGGVLSWPIHSTPRALRSLLAAYGAVPTVDQLERQRAPRGVAAVYRSRPRAINSMISMFPWGELVS